MLFQYPPKDELLICHYLIVDGALFCAATIPKQEVHKRAGINFSIKVKQLRLDYD